MPRTVSEESWELQNSLFQTPEITITFKIITRMKFYFSNYLGDCGDSLQGSFESICITLTVSLLFRQITVTGNNFTQEFSVFLCNSSYMI